MAGVIEGLAEDWHRLDERINRLSSEITTLARQDAGCERLMSVPGIGPIISSAMVAAIGTGDVFSKGRDFAAWLGLVPKQTAGYSPHGGLIANASGDLFGTTQVGGANNDGTVFEITKITSGHASTPPPWSIK